MKQVQCAHEDQVAEASRSGTWNDELSSHIAVCRTCEEVALVAGYLSAPAEASSLDEALPDAGWIWRQAERAANAAALERAMLPIIWARRMAFGLGAGVLLAALAVSWPRIASFFWNLPEFLDHHPGGASTENGGFLLALTAAFLLILIPFIFGLYSAWAED